MKRDVVQDEVLTYDDVEVPEGLAAVKLRRSQESGQWNK